MNGPPPPRRRRKLRQLQQRLPHTAKRALNWRMKRHGDPGDQPPEGRRERET